MIPPTPFHNLLATLPTDEEATVEGFKKLAGVYRRAAALAADAEERGQLLEMADRADKDAAEMERECGK